MRSARSGFERPATSIRRLGAIRPWLCSTSGSSARSRAGGGATKVDASNSWCSAIIVPASITVDVHLTRAGDAERALGNVVRDDGAGAGVGVVADGHGSHEHIVAARVDVRADGRAVLLPGVVVRGDVAGADVGAGADVRVADVR